MSVLPVGNSWQQGNEDNISKVNECYCPNCQGGNGVTLLLPTKVPGFREIVIATLTCADCGFRNSEVTFGGTIQARGTHIEFTLLSPEDLNRQVLKSDSATLILPTLGLEVPPQAQRGTLSTIEGMLSRAAENLTLLQPERLRLADIDNFYRCQRVIDVIKRIIGNVDEESDDDCCAEDDAFLGEEETTLFPFQFIVDDPAGNSYIENFQAPEADLQLHEKQYERTREYFSFFGPVGESLLLWVGSIPTQLIPLFPLCNVLAHSKPGHGFGASTLTSSLERWNNPRRQSQPQKYDQHNKC
jgi:zinc finger protein